MTNPIRIRLTTPDGDMRLLTIDEYTALPPDLRDRSTVRMLRVTSDDDGVATIVRHFESTP